MIPIASLEEAEKLLLDLAQSSLLTSPDFFSPALRSSQEESNNGKTPDYESRYKALIENLPGVVFVAPLQAGEGDAYVSPQIESILGFTQDEWLQDPIRWYARVHPEDKERWSIEAASLFLSGQPLSSTYRVLARDGRVIWFQCDARMVHGGEGKPSFIHGVGFDVTKLKEAEASLKREQSELERRVKERTQDLARINEQLKAEIAEHKRTESLLIAAKEAAETAAQAKSEFLAHMSHEIRTPMNGVLGLTALALKTELTSEQREYLSIAHSSAESLLGVINQVLDFAKAESGKGRLQLADFCLPSNIAAMISGLMHQALQKGLALEYRISSDAPKNLRGDWGRLRQVLTNLIGNAIKFTKSGLVKLDIDLEPGVQPKENPGLLLRFTVKDTGIGIETSKLNSIFDPFVQGDGSITREYGGTGLGLAITRELVIMMGGRIDVTSEPGLGSAFSFTAAFEIVPGAAKSDSVELDGCNQVTTQGIVSRRILIAEDNPVNQMVVKKALERHGHILTVTGNGLEALTAYGKSQFDIVLMDIQMPVMDGLSATRAIRSIEAEQGNCRLPIIGLTAHALPTDRARCVQAGMDGFLSKPFNIEELLMLIEELSVRYAIRNGDCNANMRLYFDERRQLPDCI